MSLTIYSNVDHSVAGGVRELLRSRGLLWDLISKDLRARYRNAVMGFVWAVLQPILMMLILYVVFGKIFGGRFAVTGGDDHPYELMLLTALIFWQFFASAFSRATVSLIDNADLIKKVYFPRELIPIASMGNSIVNLAIGLLVLIGMYSYHDHPVGIGVVWAGLVFVVQCALLIGLALLCSSLNVRFRDVGYAVEVGLMMGFYATPIFYSTDALRIAAGNYPAVLTLYALNPMVGIVSAYRTALLGNEFPPMSELGWPTICALGILIVGAFVFRRMSPTIADHL
ncbi:MAG: ABC transporter permease [Candidatus Hydrogenedentes bacterium]|nr:ABC transporter permease [Candidatus Hydrogenedentota bacterium]